MKVGFGSFTFDSDTRELLDQGRSVHVSPKAFDLLLLLIERRPNVVSKREIHERIWAGAFVGDANLSVVIAEIRQILRDDSKQARFIRTVHRVGYAFCSVAVAVESADSSGWASAPQRCWLTWNEQTIPLRLGDNWIGRDPRCEVWVDGSGVSRRHARLAVTSERATIEDLASSNGTFVAGRRVQSAAPLADGDEIELGSVKMTFRLWSEEQQQKTERIRRG